MYSFGIRSTNKMVMKTQVLTQVVWSLIDELESRILEEKKQTIVVFEAGKRRNKKWGDTTKRKKSNRKTKNKSEHFRTKELDRCQILNGSEYAEPHAVLTWVRDLTRISPALRTGHPPKNRIYEKNSISRTAHCSIAWPAARRKETCTERWLR